MRYSQHFLYTLRHDPAEAETVSHRLLLRAGLIQQITAGVYAYLPAAWRALRKIEQIVREEMDATGAQEIMMPVLNPRELWEESGRWETFGPSLVKLKDRRGHEFCLGPTHEEIVTDLVRRRVQSYRDLPLTLYQIQTKFRDEPRPRGGLLRVREFTMKDAYSFDSDAAGLDVSYQKMYRAYKNIFSRCGLPSLSVEADSGAIGGKDSHEFMLIADTGEDTVVTCPGCHYAANRERAAIDKSRLPRVAPAAMLPMAPVSTPGVKTIAELAQFLHIPTYQTHKAVFYTATYSDRDEVIFAVIRGDLEINDIKLKNALKCLYLEPATPEAVNRAGLVAGSASPVGLKGLRVIADDSITLGVNFVAGGNQPDVHLRNVNYPRDFQADLVTDIAQAAEGHPCPRCGSPLQLIRGIEVGHIFKLGTVYSEKMGAYFLDKDGQSRPIIMGCYGIGIGRLLAAAIEQNHDDKGIIWPIAIAPHHVHLMALDLDKAGVKAAAESLYHDLLAAGIEVLYDDRAESPGVKFNDADLLGLPLRVTVSPRTLKQGAVELKRRTGSTFTLVPRAEALAQIKAILDQLWAASKAGVESG